MRLSSLMDGIPLRKHLGEPIVPKNLVIPLPIFHSMRGNGRCENCNGLGFEIVEMQFPLDIQIPL